MVKGEKTMNQGEGVKKGDRKVERHGKRRKGVFRRRQRTLRQDVRHENRGLQRIAGCGSEVGTNIDSVEGNREEGMPWTEEMARGRQGGAEAQMRSNKAARPSFGPAPARGISTWELVKQEKNE
jgi:hypothetical protein